MSNDETPSTKPLLSSFSAATADNTHPVTLSKRIPLSPSTSPAPLRSSSYPTPHAPLQPQPVTRPGMPTSSPSLPGWFIWSLLMVPLSILCSYYLLSHAYFAPVLTQLYTYVRWSILSSSEGLLNHLRFTAIFLFLSASILPSWLAYCFHLLSLVLVLLHFLLLFIAFSI